jgi:hypothetical protein
MLSDNLFFLWKTKSGIFGKELSDKNCIRIIHFLFEKHQFTLTIFGQKKTATSYDDSFVFGGN